MFTRRRQHKVPKTPSNVITILMNKAAVVLAAHSAALNP
jgi:hypothetical protein